MLDGNTLELKGKLKLGKTKRLAPGPMVSWYKSWSWNLELLTFDPELYRAVRGERGHEM